MNNVQRESVLAAVQDYAPEVRNGSPPWLITFADLMVLLMCFFVLMLSFSEMDEEKFKIMSGSLTEAFGVQAEVTATDAPKGTSLDATEFSPAIPEPTADNEVRQHTVDSDLNTLDLGLELRLRELKAQEDAAAEPSAGVARGFSARHRRRTPADSPGRQQRRDSVARKGLLPFGQRSSGGRLAAPRLLGSACWSPG